MFDPVFSLLFATSGKITYNYRSGGVFVPDSGAQLAAHTLAIVGAAGAGKAGCRDVIGPAGIPAGKLRCWGTRTTKGSLNNQETTRAPAQSL